MELSLQEQEQLVSALESTPSILEAGCTQVQILETHISWVLLTDSFAFKFKKAFDLGFLDYSSLERRRHFCEEELRLNRRTAPQIYLGVVGFGGRPDAPRIAHDAAIEYAVKMRRFSQDGLLDRWATANLLQPEHMDQVAAELARFHNEIPAASAETLFGQPETLYHPIRENFEQIRESVADPRQRVWADEQEVWVAAEYARLRLVFERRKRDGFVRECHGDLHLGNLAEVDGRIVPFDCIEFNPALRWIDVMSELAFLLMDLEHRAQSELSARLLDRYLQHTGDYGGLALLRFYKHYRAMVRAKVTLIRLGQEDPNSQARLQLIETFGAYLALAGTYTRTPAPHLILTRGPSGCGKTYVTDGLLQPLNAIRIRSDVERKRIFGLTDMDDSGSGINRGIYTREATEQTYAHLQRLTREILASGYSCIVDATFLRAEQRAPFLTLAQEVGVPVTLLDFRTERKVLEQRIVAREKAGTDASEANLAVLDHQLASADPLSQAEAEQAIAVNGSRPVSAAALAEQILGRHRVS